MSSANKAVVRVPARVDSTNGEQLDEMIRQAHMEQPDADILLDLQDTEYLCSMALRCILKWLKMLRKEERSLEISEASADVSALLHTVGFTSIMSVRKGMRRVSVDGLNVIGRGATATVYQLNDDQIVKVFHPQTPADLILNEQRISRTVFLAGIPTCVPYETVRVGEGYGTIYEMIRSVPLSAYLGQHPEEADTLLPQYAALMKKLHATKAPQELVSRGEDFFYFRYLHLLTEEVMPAEVADRIRRIFHGVPEADTLIHTDANPANIIMMDGELVFIDLGGMTAGDPFWDLQGISLTLSFYTYFMPAEVFRERYGLDPQFARELWDKFLHLYYPERDPAFYEAMNGKCRLFNAAMLLIASALGLMPVTPEFKQNLQETVLSGREEWTLL